MKLNKIHHVAVICSDYEKSKHFYTDVFFQAEDSIQDPSVTGVQTCARPI